MKIYLTVLLGLAMVRFASKIKEDEEVPKIIASLILVGLHIFGIVLLWKN